MTPWDVIRRLYDSEINAGVASDWDGGITAWIGGPVNTAGNRVLTSRTFASSEFQHVGAWLDQEANRLYPQSTYARKVRTAHG
jgi:hypothetical protein